MTSPIPVSAAHLDAIRAALQRLDPGARLEAGEGGLFRVDSFLSQPQIAAIVDSVLGEGAVEACGSDAEGGGECCGCCGH